MRSTEGAPARNGASVVSVHLADVGPRAATALLARGLRPGSVDGLRHADLALAAELTKATRPQVGRVGLLAFWDDEEALDRFTRDHALADRLAGGWHARLEPLRCHGAWPGVDDDVPEGRHTTYTGPAVVLTLGRLRLSQAPRFLRTSAKAEAAVVAAPGLVWATGLAKPPFVATCSLWESTRAIASYAYGGPDRRHHEAIGVDIERPFHKRSAFVRLRAFRVDGQLAGRNPLAAGAFTPEGQLVA